MLDICKASVKNHFLPDLVNFYESGEQFFFEEKKKEGKGKAFFRASHTTLKVERSIKLPWFGPFPTEGVLREHLLPSHLMDAAYILLK